VDINFPATRQISGFEFKVGSEPVRLTVYVDSGDGKPPLGLTEQVGANQGTRDVAFNFGRLLNVKHLNFSVLDLNGDLYTYVHLWDVKFLK